MIILQNKLTKLYDEKRLRGRQYPLNLKTDGFKKIGDKVAFDNKGNPVTVPLQRLWGGIGFPLPSPKISEKISGLQEWLREIFPGEKAFCSVPAIGLHSTLFSFDLNRILKEKQLTPANRPLLDRYVNSLYANLGKYGPLEYYSNEVLLMNDGWIIACWYPQNLPQGPNADSSLDLMRKHIGVDRPNIAHTTIGGLLRNITPEEHKSILEILSDFNQKPLGHIKFDTIKIYYETKYYLSEKKLLAEIPLKG